MDDTTLRAEMKKQPFQPFEVKTADGATFQVFHPDYAMISPNGETVIIFEKSGHYSVINMKLVVSLEPVREKPVRKGKR